MACNATLCCACVVVFSFAAARMVHAQAYSANTLRTRIRNTAYDAGVSLTNVWTRVDPSRRLLMMGGTLGSTQELQRLCMSLTNHIPFITDVDMSIETPEGNPFPPTFSVGYDPWAEDEKDDE